VELNEGRIKALTGSDAISARFLYKEFFTFEPTGKFFLAFNHKPTVADDSHGFWRRVRLIPFTQQFSGKECDLHLTTKLKAEASGILNWAVAGCLRWLAEGLKAPEIVLAASQEYRQQSDPLKEFLEDCCQFGPSEVVGISELKDAYRAWCESNGYQPLDPTAFNRKLESRGPQRGRLGHDRRRLWVGLGLKATPDVEVRTGADNKSLLLVN
jgi:putative DNA primase/helicase